MSFIRRKKAKSGRIYAYEITALWDASKKQSRSTSKYLGRCEGSDTVIPKGTKRTKRYTSIKSEQRERLIQDFGDGFLIRETIKQSSLYPSLEFLLQAKPELLSLMTYRLTSPGPMYNCELWMQGNVAGTLGKDHNLSSQDISRLLSSLGDESIQRQFFKSYLKSEQFGSNNVIIDATSLPCQNSSDFNAFGYSDGGIEKQFRFHCVIDQKSKKPLFYRYVPGNVADTSTLKCTIDELKALGANHSFALLDAGYASEENIGYLRANKIDFLMRLPAARVLCKDVIEKHHNEIESLENAVQYGKRSLFVKSYKIEPLAKLLF